MAISWRDCPECGTPDCPEKYGVVFCFDESCPSNAYESMYGKTFCLTGNFSQQQYYVGRNISDAGGHVSDNMTKSVNYLVKGKQSYMSQKETIARRYGTPVIDENTLKNMITASKTRA